MVSRGVVLKRRRRRRRAMHHRHHHSRAPPPPPPPSPRPPKTPPPDDDDDASAQRTIDPTTRRPSPRKGALCAAPLRIKKPCAKFFSIQCVVFFLFSSSSLLSSSSSSSRVVLKLSERRTHVCVYRIFFSLLNVEREMFRQVKTTTGILIECWSRRCAIEKRRRRRRRMVVVSTALESVWKITWSVFLTRGGRDIAEMEKQRGARDARGSEFSNDFDDDDGCCCCSSSSSCSSSSCFSSSIFVRSLCTRNRTHLFSPKRTVSRVRDDAFLSFFVFLQTAGVRTARSARIRTSGTGEEEEAGYRSSIRNTW